MGKSKALVAGMVLEEAQMGKGWVEGGGDGRVTRTGQRGRAVPWGRLCLPQRGLFPLFSMAKPGLLHPFSYRNNTFEFTPVEAFAGASGPR